MQSLLETANLQNIFRAFGGNVVHYTSLNHNVTDVGTVISKGVLKIIELFSELARSILIILIIKIDFKNMQRSRCIPKKRRTFFPWKTLSDLGNSCSSRSICRGRTRVTAKR